MAQLNRKNIYIPDDQSQVYEKAEIFAKSHDISLSVLIGKSLEYYINSNEPNDKDIYLTIKTYSENPKIPTIKQIKFIGEEISQSEIINDKVSNEYYSKYEVSNEVVFDENNYTVHDYVGHAYTIYKTQKGKLLVYISRSHERPDDNSGEYIIIKEENSYKLYDNVSDMVEGIEDMPNNVIEDVVKFNSEIEVLDI